MRTLATTPLSPAAVHGVTGEKKKETKLGMSVSKKDSFTDW